MFAPYCSWAKYVKILPMAWLVHVVVVRLHVGDLHAVGLGEGP